MPGKHYLNQVIILSNGTSQNCALSDTRRAKYHLYDFPATDACCCCCSVANSCLTLQLHGLQHARLPCPSLKCLTSV